MKRGERNPKKEFAIEVVKRLREAGFEAMWAGGCVRDQLLGIPPKDYDVATAATPEEVRHVFGRRKTIAVGAAFGVITVLGGKQAGNIEVATFRRDAGYSDGRHPDRVTFSSAREDAQRRDFTINGLFYDPLAQQVIDYVGGQADIRDGVLRAIGDAEQRIDEDKLRMLRAIRFTATYGLLLDPATLDAVQRHAAEISVVSAERIAGELRRMLVHPQRAEAVRLLGESRLLWEILPESRASFTLSDKGLPADVAKVAAWRRTLDTMRLLREPSFSLALAGLLWEVVLAVQRDSGRTLRKSVEEITRRWKLSNAEMRTTRWLVEHVADIQSASDLPWPRIQRVLIHDNAVDLVDLAEAIANSENGDPDPIDFCRQRLAWPPERLDPPPLIDGDDLKAAGIPPGPRYSRLLRRVRDAQLDGQVGDKASALAFAKAQIGSSSQPGGSRG